MGLIIRTAGQERSKAEIKRDYEYLLRLWNEIRETTLKSIAPKLIYEEGDLIKRAMRDLYTRDIEEVLVEGDEGYRSAKRLMTMLMPSRARLVKPYSEETPLFFAYQGRGPARRDAQPDRAAALGRLDRDPHHRGADRDRRQLRPLDARAPHRRDRRSRPTSRPPTRSPASCACATSPG